MKTNLTCAWVRRATLLILAATLNAPVLILAQTPTTTFTYQGQLVDKGTGVPVTGFYDMRFYLRDGPTGENAISTTTNVFDGTVNNFDPVWVDKGLFTTNLNFGATPFNGARVWLQIEVRNHTLGGSYERLPDRTELTPAPYAIYAQSAGTVGNLPNNIVTSGTIAGGQVVKSLNGLKDDVSLSAGANVTLTPNGNSIQVSATGGGIWNLNGTSAYYSRGNVGIGTTVPSSLLDMSQVYNQFKPFSPFIRAVTVSKFGLLDTNFVVESTGAIGIGTGEPSSKLSIVNGGPQLIGTALSSTFVASAGLLPSDVGGDSPLANFGVTTEGNNVSLGLRARRISAGTGWTTAAIGLTFDVDDTVQAGGGLWLASSGNVGSGNVGIGTAQPQAPLHVDVPATADPVTAMKLEVESFSNITNAIASDFLIVRDVGSGKMAFKIRGDGYVGIGTNDPQSMLHVAGLTTTRALCIEGGSDIAEPFEMSDRELAKGSLVVIDMENPGKLKLAAKEYDTSVAGIISGANGINAGISLRQEGVTGKGQNVALTGRVYALADATYGTIRPGDLLTSSGTPGHVMKVTNQSRAQGAIVGKAMSGLKQGKGMVLVLVSLQ